MSSEIERCTDCGRRAEPYSDDPHRVQDWGDILLCLPCAEIRGLASHTCCPEVEA